MDQLEIRTIAKVSARLVPFLIVCYFVAYLDRVNVSFAALEMNKSLGLSATAFGLGAGIFFLTYFVFEVPSNLALERFGARLWIARIMITWGILSGAMAFIPQISSALGVRPTYTFYGVRLLLGAAEAGFFPGIIFYLTLWFPQTYRGRIVGYFMAAIPLSSVIGAPISGLVLRYANSASLAGWQWLFIIEAVPALLLAIAVLFYLTDRPEQAAWLAPGEREWLSGRLDGERRQRERAQHYSVGQALMNPKVIALALVYFGAVAANYGVGFFLPQIVKAFGLTDVQTGLVSAVPYIVGTIGMVLWGRSSDRRMERKSHAAIALACSAIGVGAAAFLSDPLAKMIALSVGAFGAFAVLPVFWTFPTAFLAGPAAAGGIAIINALGNLAGFAGPFVMGRIKDSTGSFFGGLLCIAGVALVAMGVVIVLPHNDALERAPDPMPAE